MSESYQTEGHEKPTNSTRQSFLRGLVAGGLCTLVLITGASLMLFGCASKQVKSYYVDDYLQALQEHHGVTDSDLINRGVEQFAATLGDFTVSDLRQQVESLYADKLYFNDTFKTLRSIDELAPYLQETGETVTTSSVEVLSHTQDGEDVYVRWVMDFAFKAAGKDIESRSLGMSHLRFNSNGEIVMHQDFWDSNDGFYSNLPFIGGMLHRVRKKL